VEHTHGFTLGAAQSFVSALRQSRVRDTNSTALSQSCLCGNRKKNPFSQRVHHCERGMKEHRDLLSAYLGLHVHRNTDGLDRLDLKAVNVAGFTVRTSTGAEVQSHHHPTGEAADIRQRGGQLRASERRAKPRPRSDRAGRHKLPPPTGLWRCTHEQRDNRAAGGIPDILCREDVNYC
jgi:hypothetical protein